jgi:hypothetical protein
VKALAGAEERANEAAIGGLTKAQLRRNEYLLSAASGTGVPTTDTIGQRLVLDNSNTSRGNSDGPVQAAPTPAVPPAQPYNPLNPWANKFRAMIEFGW